jgi:hypothetical protein
VCPRYLSFDEHAAAAEGFFLRLEVGLRREVGCIVVQIGIEVVGLLEELSGGQRDELFERDAAGRVSVEQDMAQLLVRLRYTEGIADTGMDTADATDYVDAMDANIPPIRM